MGRERAPWCVIESEHQEYVTIGHIEKRGKGNPALEVVLELVI